MGMDKEIAEIN